MLVTSIFSFSHNVFHPTQCKIKVNFSLTFILLSADAFNLDRSKILSFGKELTMKQIENVNIVLLYIKNI